MRMVFKKPKESKDAHSKEEQSKDLKVSNTLPGPKSLCVIQKERFLHQNIRLIFLLSLQDLSQN